MGQPPGLPMSRRHGHSTPAGYLHHGEHEECRYSLLPYRRAPQCPGGPAVEIRKARLALTPRGTRDDNGQVGSGGDRRHCISGQEARTARIRQESLVPRRSRLPALLDRRQDLSGSADSAFGSGTSSSGEDSDASDPDYVPSDVEVSGNTPLPRSQLTRSQSAETAVPTQDVSQSPLLAHAQHGAILDREARKDQNDCDDRQDPFDELLRHDRLSHFRNESSRRSAAGWVSKFVLSRQAALSDAEQLRAFLLAEGETTGPQSIHRKGYWICQAAPLVSNWRPPPEARQIIKSAENVASLDGLTGGALPVTRAQVRKVVDRRRSSPKAFQVALFAALTFISVSRGGEIFGLTRGDISFDEQGNAMLWFPRTKTATGIHKLIPNRSWDRFNPARALKAWVPTATRHNSDSIWRMIGPSGGISLTCPLAASTLRTWIHSAFGPSVSWHSFRKGAATELAVANTNTEVLLSMGTWSSTKSMLRYMGNGVRTHPGVQGHLASILLQPPL
ncbi:hypothetical protein J8273_1538 [Carpediemonas membranifera]|uniref:Uncharacterized protein n=1 Tax=Carpediemonas membranifera TaxID=201153 RepID=A0A8J6EB84_9EUKA|nr:hypothetical protein J8273_1538 [Carpediemonas membranifera]|eukprot:KAG9396535.1 hypothetical protein J8273_1538 [Carpediemonas membranifera]